jgi:hypothetical protein
MISHRQRCSSRRAVAGVALAVVGLAAGCGRIDFDLLDAATQRDAAGDLDGSTDLDGGRELDGSRELDGDTGASDGGDTGARDDGDTGALVDVGVSGDGGPPECDMCSCSTAPVFETTFDEGSTVAFTGGGLGGCAIAGTGMLTVSGGVARVSGAPSTTTEEMRANCFRRGLTGTMSGHVLIEDLLVGSATTTALAPLFDLRATDSVLVFSIYFTSSGTLQLRTYAGLTRMYLAQDGPTVVTPSASHDIDISFVIDTTDDGVDQGVLRAWLDGVLEIELVGLPPPTSLQCVTYLTFGTFQLSGAGGWMGEVDFTVGAIRYTRGP